jgi:hypothetical protein
MNLSFFDNRRSDRINGAGGLPVAARSVNENGRARTSAAV